MRSWGLVLINSSFDLARLILFRVDPVVLAVRPA